ncbi:MAG: DUF3501 family protein [Proteobacteria bacterium]|nr:DUF3501 family protein [Pseudomonadota bacterium]
MPETDHRAPRGRLAPPDLLSLEQYARQRADFRARVLAHKRARTLAVGPHTTWCFEDRLTVQYQVQEMLRAERIFEVDGIQDELDAYNPLIPDGTNLKVTLLIEYPDPAERAIALARLKGIEDRCYVEAAGQRSYAIADEDLDRENDEKTSAVHFLRFELGAEMRRAFHAGAPIAIGIDLPAYTHALSLGADSRAALAADLAP